ncbi:probable disease resistance protein At5g66900 isoform X1 [Argentina anserina]|uniref:probable disease resistance protein At5g66900 isoform X1 n=1 Tax=Argentina anserina TaxID=57926 RepID=UPI002176702A|nr:probable disease resistance protein At5g66900 isoform X1 [Potentilla anserina]
MNFLERKREMELSKSDSIVDAETDMLLLLKSSLDALDENEAIIKECFVDLASFPEGRRISLVALIDMWAELHDGLVKDVLAVANLLEFTGRSLADLVVTRKLSISHCHKLSALPEEIGKLDLLEVLRLRSCTDLVELPSSNIPAEFKFS